MVTPQHFTELAHRAAIDGIQQIVVGAVAGHDSRVLILKRPADDFMGSIWELPSGKVEPNEALDQALAREVLEETGLTVTDITHYLGSFDYLSGSGKRRRQYNFAVDVEKPEPVKLTEHDAYQWTNVSDDLPVTGAVRMMIREWERIGHV